MPRRLRSGRVVPCLFATAAVLAGAVAAARMVHAIDHPSTRAWLDAAYDVLRAGVTAMFAFFTVGRATPKQPARSPVGFVACAVAMGTAVALGAPPSASPDAVVLVGELIAVSFCVWLFVSVLNLGRCFGVLPEARGLVTAGPYGVVRHPVYLGEIGACLGLLVAAPTLANFVAFGVLWLAQGVRMHLEERALGAAFPGYQSYAADVPRLVPSPRRALRKLVRPARGGDPRGGCGAARYPASAPPAR